MAGAASYGMAYAQRSFERQVDELVLAASPAELARLQDIDRRARLSGMSFYDAYLGCAGACRKEGGSAGAAPGGQRRGRRAQRGRRRGEDRGPRAGATAAAPP